MNFYTIPLIHCACGKPATCEVQGTGNVKYDTCCDECGVRRVEELRAYWNSQSQEVQTDHIHIPGLRDLFKD